MTSSRQSVTSILQMYPGNWSNCRVNCLGNNGGYSGANIWRIETDNGTYCLRQWPVQKVKTAHLHWVHQVLSFVADQEFPPSILPLPYPNKNGNSLTFQGQTPFELTDWLPGNADFWQNPSSARVESAVKTLAMFHQAAKGLKCQRKHGADLRGVIQRRSLVSELNGGLLRKIESAIGSVSFANLARTLVSNYRRLEPTISNRLQHLSRFEFESQACIRDIWHDHLFFQGNDVSGIVDFGAMDHDNVATDLARLFGSLFGNSPQFWRAGLEAYQAINELSDLELELIEVYDRSTTMLAGMNWLKWILVENRKFDSYLPIIKRMELLSQRMRDWI